MSYKKFTPGFTALALVGLVFLLGPDSACSENYQTDKVIQHQNKHIKIEVADSPIEHERGLSGRKCIDKNQGMLFVFKEPGYYNFWMKDMKFPIDIVWIDNNKRVIEVTDNIQPTTYPDTFASNQASNYVLEVGAGLAAKLGLSAGEKLNF